MDALAADPWFRTAVLLATDGLRHRLETGVSDQKAARRAVMRLLAYAIRMATRTTPFGLFASVGLVQFDDEERFVETAAERTAHANVDREWLAAAVETAVRRANEAGEDVIVTSATAVRRAGPRVVLLDERKTGPNGDATSYRSVSIKASPPIEFALAAARDGVSSAELAAALVTRFTVEPDIARSLLRKLIDARFLVPIALPAPLDDALDRLAGIALRQASLAGIVDAAHRATSLKGLPNLDTLDATAASMHALGGSDVRHPVFHDLTHGPIALPERVRGDVLSLADVVVRCALTEDHDAYRMRFLERYESEHRFVPLLTLIGPDGIGLPGRFEFRRQKPPPHTMTRWAARIAAATRAQRREIVLNEDEWESLRPSVPEPLPASLEVAFTVLAPSFDAIRAGDYLVASSPLVGTASGARTTGRFAKYFGPGFSDALREVVASTAPGNAIIAEPMFVPADTRAGNVIAHPVIADAVIPINVDAAGLRSIALDDLTVGIADGVFALRSVSLGRAVHVVWPHAYNTVLAPPIARFLAFVASEKARHPAPLDLGDIAMLPFVPRIRVGRVLVRCATWTITVEAFRRRGLRAVAQELQMPRYVAFGQVDNMIAIDTDGDAGEALLTDQYRARRDDEVVVFAEAFVSESNLWLRDRRGARYCGEFIASVRRLDRPAAAPDVAVSDEYARNWTPGSRWCYVKLYTGLRDVRAHVGPRVLEFACGDAVRCSSDRWFYVLYRDPGEHVRLRVRAREGAERAVRDACLEFANGLVHDGLVTRFALATYERELERYGGTTAIDYAEELFHLDSVDALSSQPVDGLTGSTRIASILRPLVQLLEQLTNDAEQRQYLTERRPPPRRASSDESAAVRAVAAQPPSRHDQRAPVARRAASACDGHTPWLNVVDSVLHMHLNRRGIAAEEELTMRELLWKVLFSRAARAAGS